MRTKKHNRRLTRSFIQKHALKCRDSDDVKFFVYKNKYEKKKNILAIKRRNFRNILCDYMDK